MCSAEHQELLSGALELDKWSIGRLISLFEDTREAAGPQRQQILESLARRSQRRAAFVGLTGPPGVGKSTLIGALAPRLLHGAPHKAVAVLAIDPSSPHSGGALLGDRTRVHFPLKEKRLFFRSQASALALGGVGRHTFQVCRLLHRLFDLVLLETVGIGQSETDVRHIADVTYLILQPMTGDQVQLLKAGIMEIPDGFILNKSDLPGHQSKARHALESSFQLLHPGRQTPPSIHETSALHNTGLDLLAAELLALPPQPDMASKEAHHLRAWIDHQLGQWGLRCLRQSCASATLWIEECGGFDAAKELFFEHFITWIQKERR